MKKNIRYYFKSTIFIVVLYLKYKYSVWLKRIYDRKFVEHPAFLMKQRDFHVFNLFIYIFIG